MDGWKTELVDRRINEVVDGWMDGWIIELVDGWMDN